MVMAQESSFKGLSVYTATGLQKGSVTLSDVTVSNTNIPVPTNDYHSTGTPWMVGLNYAHALSSRITLAAQIDYFPVSQQVALSILPGYEFTSRTLGYIRLGWVHAPSTVDQGPGRAAYKVNLNGVVGGIGAKYLVTPNLYGFVELNYVKFEQLRFTSWVGQIPITGNANSQAVNLLLGVGYRF
jgi:opacity protein-like surface antigen